MEEKQDMYGSKIEDEQDMYESKIFMEAKKKVRICLDGGKARYVWEQDRR